MLSGSVVQRAYSITVRGVSSVVHNDPEHPLPAFLPLPSEKVSETDWTDAVEKHLAPSWRYHPWTNEERASQALEREKSNLA